MNEQILAVQRMQDHIEAHLEEDYAQAILVVEQAMDRYAPTFIGYQWNDRDRRISRNPGDSGAISNCGQCVSCKKSIPADNSQPGCFFTAGLSVGSGVAPPEVLPPSS